MADCAAVPRAALLPVSPACIRCAENRAGVQHLPHYRATLHLASVGPSPRPFLDVQPVEQSSLNLPSFLAQWPSATLKNLSTIKPTMHFYAWSSFLLRSS